MIFGGVDCQKEINQFIEEALVKLENTNDIKEKRKIINHVIECSVDAMITSNKANTLSKNGFNALKKIKSLSPSAEDTEEIEGVLDMSEIRSMGGFRKRFSKKRVSKKYRLRRSKKRSLRK